VTVAGDLVEDGHQAGCDVLALEAAYPARMACRQHSAAWLTVGWSARSWRYSPGRASWDTCVPGRLGLTRAARFSAPVDQGPAPHG
jgi:hypothetical protein